MSHFYGIIHSDGARGKTGRATRCGLKSGIETTAASFSGAIVTELACFQGEDHYRVCEYAWSKQGRGELRRVICDWRPFGTRTT